MDIFVDWLQKQGTLPSGDFSNRESFSLLVENKERNIADLRLEFISDILLSLFADLISLKIVHFLINLRIDCQIGKLIEFHLPKVTPVNQLHYLLLSICLKETNQHLESPHQMTRLISKEESCKILLYSSVDHAE